MATPIRDCECEDFPCCVHADNFPDTETIPGVLIVGGGVSYCDVCGFVRPDDHTCYDWEDEEEEEDAED